jgi:hypothetical protein
VTSGPIDGSRRGAPADPFELTSSTADGPGLRWWRIGLADCPELAPQRISRLGRDDGCAPYRRVRLRPAGVFFLACVQGEDRILIDGRWQRVAKGMASIAPLRVVNAFFAT